MEQTSILNYGIIVRAYVSGSSTVYTTVATPRVNARVYTLSDGNLFDAGYVVSVGTGTIRCSFAPTDFTRTPASDKQIYRQSEVKGNNIVFGYYHDSKFYKDLAYTQLVSGEEGKVYFDFVNLQSIQSYVWRDNAYHLTSGANADGGVIADALVRLNNDIVAMRQLLGNYGLDARLGSVDALDYMTGGFPVFLRASSAGAPSASIVPDNWDEDRFGVWRGVPLAPNMVYTDLVSRKVYFAPRCTNSTGDWIALN